MRVDLEHLAFQSAGDGSGRGSEIDPVDIVGQIFIEGHR